MQSSNHPSASSKFKGSRHTTTTAARRGRRGEALAASCRPVIENLEGRRLLTGDVTTLTLINADTDKVVGTIQDGATINVSELGTRNLNVRADVSGDVESVRFGLDGKSNFRTENSDPYSLAGDKNGLYHAWTASLGEHTLTATPFDRDDAAGTAGGAMKVTFNVVDRVTEPEQPEPQPTAPAAPAALSATADGTSAIALAWEDKSEDETGFKVEQSSNGGSTWTQVGTVAAGVTSYHVTGLAADTTYAFRVRATNAAGDSGYSNVATATTAAAPAPSPEFINEDFSSGANDFTTHGGTWAVVGGRYAITSADTQSPAPLGNLSVHAAALPSGDDFTLEADASVVASSTAWNDFGVVFGYQDADNYYFVSFNESNDGATSGIFRVVNGVQAELVDISRSITADTTYQVRVERSGGQIRAYLNDALAATTSDAGYAGGAVGFGTRNDEAAFDNLVVKNEAPPPPTSAPAAPSSLTAAAQSTSQVKLTWQDRSSDEVGFRVERSTDGSSFTEVASVGANVTTYTATGLSDGTKYYFRVRAYNAVGTSAYSAVASATTTAEDTNPTPPDSFDSWTDLRSHFASRTGPTSDSLRASGGITTTHDGQVIEGVNLSGGVTIRHKNVTIRNFRISSGGAYGIRVEKTGAGAVIENGEITGSTSAGIFAEAGATIRGVEIHHVQADAIKLQGFEGSLVEGNWWHHLGMASGSHADGIQIRKGSNFTIRGNFSDMPTGVSGTNTNSAFIIGSALSAIDNVLIDGNWLNGGNYTVYILDADMGNPTNVRITNNWFGRDFRYGTHQLDGDVAWSNNRWFDTGSLIPR